MLPTLPGAVMALVLALPDDVADAEPPPFSEPPDVARTGRRMIGGGRLPSASADSGAVGNAMEFGGRAAEAVAVAVAP